MGKTVVFPVLPNIAHVMHAQKLTQSLKKQYTPTPWLTLLLVLGKSRVKQNLC